MSKCNFVVLMLITLIVQGCSSQNFEDLFSGYAQQMKTTRAAQQSGDFVQALTLLGDKNKSDNNYVLSLLEKGRLQHLAGAWSASETSFNYAYQQIQAQQEKAKIQLSRGLKKLEAVVSNDNALVYEVPSYEQSMLHTYQALNYLYLGRLDSALVEIRRANIIQEQALAQHQQMLFEAQSDREKQSSVSHQQLDSAYPSLEAMIGSLKNGFQNAFTFYLSGLLYEAAGELNDAVIDYKRALEIAPHNTYVQQDILRLLTKLSMSDDLALFEQKFGRYKTVAQQGKGQVVLIVEQGLVQAKTEQRIDLPVYDYNGPFRMFSFALPVYFDQFVEQSPLLLHYQNKEYRAEKIVALQALAAKNLKDDLPGLVTRQAVRLVAKEQIRRQMSKEAGNLGSVLASIYNLASERADTRSWSTLPSEVQILRIYLASGKQSLSVTVAGQTKTINVDVEDQRTTLVNFTITDRYIGYQTVNL